MNPVWFVRMYRWVRHPPSPKRVKLVFALLAVCAVIFGLEWAGLWPEMFTLDRPARMPQIR